MNISEPKKCDSKTRTDREQFERAIENSVGKDDDNSATTSRSKKRDHSLATTSNMDKNSCKFMKFDCDSSNSDCENYGAVNTTNLANTVTNVIENLNIACNAKDGESSSASEVDLKNLKKHNEHESAGPSKFPPLNCRTKSDSESSIENSESSLSSDDTSSSVESVHYLPDMNLNDAERTLDFNEDSSLSSSDSSSFSSSSNDFDGLSMSSSFEDDDDFYVDENEYFAFGDEDNPDSIDSEKPPAVLKKTLPAYKFSFPKEIILREINSGDSRRRSHSNFDGKIYGSRNMVQRLQKFRVLKKHYGSVNTLSFNTTGDILISGSDDKHACLWDWKKNKSLLYFDTGHTANVLQAQFLPHSNDTKLITCAQDSMIRMSQLDECGLKTNSLITKHSRSVHRITMQPQMSNSFLSAGEDGFVFAVDVRENNSSVKKLLKVTGNERRGASAISLYCVSCNPLKNHEFIVAGNSEKIRLYDQRNISKTKQSPLKEFKVRRDLSERNEFMDGKLTTVTCAIYNYNGTEILASYNHNDVFLFNADDPSNFIFRYDGHRNLNTIKEVNFFGPKSEYVVSGSDCGYIYVWDKKSESIIQWIKGDKDIVNCLEPHPAYPVLATSGLESNVKIWMPSSTRVEDVRNNKDFQKVVKKNSFYKIMGSAQTDLGVSLFYFLASGRRGRRD